MRRLNINWLIIALVLASALPTVSALGIAPGHIDIVFEPHSTSRNTLKLINSDDTDMQVVLYAEGELAPYITFDEPLVELKKGQLETYTHYTLTLPASFEKQGLHTSNVVARGIPVGSKGTGVTMSAIVAVVSQVNVMVPYQGKYAEITLFSPNFDEGKKNNFAFEVRNLGTEDILKGQVIVDIYGPMNNKLKSIPGDIFSLPSKENKVVVIDWLPDVGPGTYKAVANLLYDGQNAKDERQFLVGEFSIDIVDISVDSFKLSGIAMFNILLENRWNEKISGVYADFSVKSKDGVKIYAQSKTASVDIPDSSKATLQAYWNTQDVGPGEYQLDIVLNALGKKTERLFNISVSTNKIDINTQGQLVSPEDKSTSTVMQGIYLLTFLVLILIIFNVIMFLRKSKDKK